MIPIVPMRALHADIIVNTQELNNDTTRRNSQVEQLAKPAK